MSIRIISERKYPNKESCWGIALQRTQLKNGKNETWAVAETRSPSPPTVFDMQRGCASSASQSQPRRPQIIGQHWLDHKCKEPIAATRCFSFVGLVQRRPEPVFSCGFCMGCGKARLHKNKFR